MTFAFLQAYLGIPPNSNMINLEKFFNKNKCQNWEKLKVL